MVDMPGIETLRPAELSGGMKKRVGLARSIAIQPEVILYDEPTTGLHFEDVKKLVNDIDRHVDTGAETTWIGHDQSQIELQEAHSSNRQWLKPPRYTFRSMQAPARIPVIELLKTWGPDQRPVVTIDEANRYCRDLTLSHGENFSVLTRYVPGSMLEGVCAVYAFCRWADDLADEPGDPSRSLELLGWWREELRGCFAGTAGVMFRIYLLTPRLVTT